MYNLKLQELFDKQKTLQYRNYGVALPDHLPGNLPMQVTGVVAELGEVLAANEAWKDWKKHPRAVDGSHLLDEVADLWHFIINLTLYSGYDALNVDDVNDMFIHGNNLKDDIKHVPIAVHHLIQNIGAVLDTPRLIYIKQVWRSLVDLTIALGYDFDVLYAAFIAKNKVNHIRQDNQY